MDALAVDTTVALEEYDIPNDVKILNLNDPDEIIQWILTNAKEV
jgi:molybdopterin-guanine dinucleotide biosynthesis protein B